MRPTIVTVLCAVTCLVVSALFTSASAEVRLGTDVVPTFEQIRLRANADTSDYSGSVKVELDVRKPTTTLALHAEGQTLQRVKLTQAGKPIAVKQSRGEFGLLTLTASSTLAVGQATLEIDFTNPFNTKAVGLYRMAKEGHGYLFTQFEATDARKAFPCWDEPCFKFPYQITVEIPQTHQALSNTPIERETRGGRWKTIAFEKTPPMPSYLLALAIGPLEFVDVPGLKFRTRIVTIQGQSRLAQLAVESTPPIVAALEKYFDMPYPYKKLDLVAVPEYWFGAMENPGAITFTESALLLDPKSVSAESRNRLTRFTAHELAHMWFGDLVTMTWWDDMWLNESFADWMGDKITEEVAPQFQHQLGEMRTIQDVMGTDARPSTDPIRLPPTCTGNDAMRAVGLAYNKGKAVLGMFEQWMGPEVFRRGVNEYLRTHAWKNAVAGDLWASLGKASGQNVTAAMAGFIEQQGLPLISAEPLPDGSVRLTQRRFLNYGVKADPLLWKVPVGIKWSDGSQVRIQSVLLDAPSATVKLEGGAGKPVWVLPNAGGRGYYRWSVPRDVMLALSKQSVAAMSPPERIGFLGNASALLDAGELQGEAYLRMLADFSNDPAPLVASAVIDGLGNAKADFVSDDLRPAFAVYVRRTLTPMAKRFGLEKKPGEPEVVSLLRPELFGWLGDEGNDPGAMALAAKLSTLYMQDPAAPDPSLVGMALGLHAMDGDRALFDRYRKEFESAKTPAARQSYCLGLGAFKDRALQDVALEYALSGSVRLNEIRYITGGIRSQSDQGRDRIFQWLRDHYAELASKIPEEFQASFPAYAGGCDARRIAIAKEFFSQPAHRVQGTEKELSQVVEAVEDCVGLRGREGPAVAAYLRGLAADATTQAAGSK